MPHIIILEEWCQLACQLNGYAHDIQENIDNEVYSGQQLVDAEAALTDLSETIEKVNTDHRTEMDARVGQCEAVLGI